MVDGVYIELTKEQSDLIDEHAQKRKRFRNSFTKMLRFFGFKKIRGIDSYIHVTQNWFADIHDRGSYHTCWMVGEGLKCSKLFPGGWVYESPEEIETELLKYYDRQLRYKPKATRGID